MSNRENGVVVRAIGSHMIDRARLGPDPFERRWSTASYCRRCSGGAESDNTQRDKRAQQLRSEG